MEENILKGSMMKRVKADVAKNTKKNEKQIDDLKKQIEDLKIANSKELNRKIHDFKD